MRGSGRYFAVFGKICVNVENNNVSVFFSFLRANVLYCVGLLKVRSQCLRFFFNFDDALRLIHFRSVR